jgi:predicted O-linked N-acetylglucosamine transferase (SPINDLY family)
LVTRFGDTFASRVAGSIVLSAGLPELVVDTREQYERLTTDLARSPQRLAGVRSALRERRDTCVLFDSPRRTRDLESAYEAMFEAWRRNDAPWPHAAGAG